MHIFHKWTKWQHTRNILSQGTKRLVGLYYERKCTKCGKTESYKEYV